ncbi:MAG: YlmH/Sll1252 family protein [Ruminococcus sp.]
MDEIKLLQSRIDDLVREASSGKYTYIGFLNEKEASVANSYVKNKGVHFAFNGGYEGASRVVLLVSDDEYSLYDHDLLPFSALIVKARDGAKLSHRDYLGSFMSLGIKRECVGDIVSLDSSTAVVFLLKEMSAFILSELSGVGGESVKVDYYKGSTEKFADKYEQLSVIVSSMRADSVVSACAKVSRSESTKLISSDSVFINYSVTTKVSQTVNFGDIISIRGFGKFKIVKQVTTTRRDRLVLSVLHYI